MPSDRSIYRKIQVVLDVAKSFSANSVGHLAGELRSRRFPEFISRKYDPKRDDYVDTISDRIINKSIKICLTLGLISVEGSLTREGRKAVSGSTFDGVVARKIRSIFTESGIDFAEMNLHITECLHSKPLVLPTPRQIWENSATELGYSQFSRLLTLLSHCGGAESSQKKIYLKIALK